MPEKADTPSNFTLKLRKHIRRACRGASVQAGHPQAACSSAPLSAQPRGACSGAPRLPARGRPHPLHVDTDPKAVPVLCPQDAPAGGCEAAGGGPHRAADLWQRRSRLPPAAGVLRAGRPRAAPLSALPALFMRSRCAEFDGPAEQAPGCVCAPLEAALPGLCSAPGEAWAARLAGQDSQAAPQPAG